jgi:competence protein ComEC
LLGEKLGLSPEIEDLFRRAGATHLLVVSGLHLAMVGGLFYFFFRILFSLWPPLLLRISVRKWAFLAALFPIIFYASLVGFSPSVLRSVVTVFFLGALLLLSRQRDAFSILILVAFSLLLFQPLVLFDLSFQLSFLSVASMILFVPRWETFLRRRSEFFAKPWIKRPLEILLASLAVQIGLFPVLVQQFHQISWVSLPANLVLVPTFSLFIMPLGMLGMFCSWLFPTEAPFVFKGVVWLLKPLLSYLQLLTSFPGCYPYWPGFNFSQTSFYYLGLFAFLLPFSFRYKKRVMVFLLILNLGSWIFPLLWDRWDRSLTLTFLDVGQGDSTLIRLPHGKRVLIDGGGIPSSPFDMGEQVLLPYFLSKNIGRLDTVILTHPHPDHYGGLKSVMEALHPKEFLWNGEMVEDPWFQEFLNDVRRLKIPTRRLDASIPPFSWEGVRWEVLHPSAGGFHDKKPSSGSVNNHSLVMQLNDRGLNILLTGDLQSEGEDELLKNNKVSPAFVLKVPHHGSDTSSTPAWVSAVCPRIALIGVGRDNRFRFPRDEVVRRYEAMGTRIFRTDRDGEINLRWDGSELKVSSFAGERWSVTPNLPNPLPSNPRGTCVGSSFGYSSGSSL